jgi:hypothetical protein
MLFPHVRTCLTYSTILKPFVGTPHVYFERRNIQNVPAGDKGLYFLFRGSRSLRSSRVFSAIIDYLWSICTSGTKEEKKSFFLFSRCRIKNGRVSHSRLRWHARIPIPPHIPALLCACMQRAAPQGIPRNLRAATFPCSSPTNQITGKSARVIDKESERTNERTSEREKKRKKARNNSSSRLVCERTMSGIILSVLTFVSIKKHRKLVLAGLP